MRKLLLISFILYGPAPMIFSQSYLTVGQVYNFNVGDIFEAEYSTDPPQSPPIFDLTIVLGKWYSAHSDTVFYRDSVVSYAPPACPPPCVGSFSTGIDTISYTNLNSKAVQDTTPNECPAVWDSIYTNASVTCWQKVWEQGPSRNCLDTLPPTFDGYNTTYSWLIEGCGGPYTNILFEGYEYTCYYSLIYSKKHDTICGAEYIITGINQVNPVLTNFKIYPNPSDGIFTITSNSLQPMSGLQKIEIFNVLGEQVLTEPLCSAQVDNSINLSAQPDGVYLYRIITENGSLVGEGKLVVQK